MAAKAPGRAGTRHGAEIHKWTPRILHPRRYCASCETPLYRGEFRHCRPCVAHISNFRAIQGMRGLYD